MHKKITVLNTHTKVSTHNCPSIPPSASVCSLADSGFFKNFLYRGGVKSKVSWIFEDLKFKISEGYDQIWCFPDSAQLAVSV